MQHHKALLQNVLTSDVKARTAVGDTQSFQIRHALARVFSETNTFPASVAQAADVRLIHFQAFPSPSFARSGSIALGWPGILEGAESRLRKLM